MDPKCCESAGTILQMSGAESRAKLAFPAGTPRPSPALHPTHRHLHLSRGGTVGSCPAPLLPRVLDETGTLRMPEHFCPPTPSSIATSLKAVSSGMRFRVFLGKSTLRTRGPAFGDLTQSLESVFSQVLRRPGQQALPENAGSRQVPKPRSRHLSSGSSP